MIFCLLTELTYKPIFGSVLHQNLLLYANNESLRDMVWQYLLYMHNKHTLQLYIPQ